MSKPNLSAIWRKFVRRLASRPLKESSDQLDRTRRLLAACEQERDDERRKANGFEIMLEGERERAEEGREREAELIGLLRAATENNLELSAHLRAALESVEILQTALRERQQWAGGDPTRVVVVGDALPPMKKERRPFVPLRERRLAAMRKSDEEQVRRTAAPAPVTLPDIPLNLESARAAAGQEA